MCCSIASANFIFALLLFVSFRILFIVLSHRKVEFFLLFLCASLDFPNELQKVIRYPLELFRTFAEDGLARRRGKEKKKKKKRIQSTNKNLFFSIFFPSSSSSSATASPYSSANTNNTSSSIFSRLRLFAELNSFSRPISQLVCNADGIFENVRVLLVWHGFGYSILRETCLLTFASWPYTFIDESVCLVLRAANPYTYHPQPPSPFKSRKPRERKKSKTKCYWIFAPIDDENADDAAASEHSNIFL